MATNNNVSSSSSGGIGFVGLLTIAFIVLKLTGVVNWSWLWVLSPLWISAALTLTILLIVGIVVLSIYLADKSKRKNYKKAGKK